MTPADDISAKTKDGKQLHPGGRKWFSPKLLPWLRRRKQGVDESSIQHRTLTMKQEALRQGRLMLGVVERGGNNRGPEVDKIILANGGKLGEAWCGDAVAYWYRKAGSKVVQRGWAATRLLGHLIGMKSKGPRAGEPGDIVVFNFPGGDPTSDHTGLLIAYTNAAGKKVPASKAAWVKTLDGNTGIDANVSDSKHGGDGIGIKVRPISFVNRTVEVLR